MAGAVVAATARERRRIAAALRDAGAVSAVSAIAPGRLGDIRFHMLARLQAQGAVRTADDGRVWLDEDAWAALVRTRRWIAMGVLLAIVLLIAISVAFTTVSTGAS